MAFDTLHRGHIRDTPNTPRLLLRIGVPLRKFGRMCDIYREIFPDPKLPAPPLPFATPRWQAERRKPSPLTHNPETLRPYVRRQRPIRCREHTAPPLPIVLHASASPVQGVEPHLSSNETRDQRHV